MDADDEQMRHVRTEAAHGSGRLEEALGGLADLTRRLEAAQRSNGALRSNVTGELALEDH